MEFTIPVPLEINNFPKEFNDFIVFACEKMAYFSMNSCISSGKHRERICLLFSEKWKSL